MASLIAMPSKRLILSYIFDWICILAIAAIGGGLNSVTPSRRPFSLIDLDISYPYVSETITTAILIVVSLIAPAVIILLIALIFVPGRTAARGTPRSLIWRRKLWEWNTGWMGLGLSYALAFFITQGMKNLFGTPRPDLLQRCQPDLSRLATSSIDTFARNFNSEWVLVDYSICTQTDTSILNDGFRSFPSGHSSSSWAGLFYLALFLCSKFAITIPFLPNRPFSRAPANNNTFDRQQKDAILPLHSTPKSSAATASEQTTSTDAIPLRNQAAAPPTYLLFLPLIPLSVAVYISSTRYFQFYHHGFDIIAGSLIGIGSAWFAFRWYHLPISRGAGWSWGARSRDRAWAVGVGMESYVGAEGWSSKKQDRDEVAGAGDSVTGPGISDEREGMAEV